MSQERVKKLVSISTISISVTKNSEEAILVSAKELEQVTCIQYFIAFPGGVTQDGLVLGPVLALLDSSGEVNAIYPTFAEKLSLEIQKVY